MIGVAAAPRAKPASYLPTAPTVDWSETAAMAAGRMRAASTAWLVVVGERGNPLGRITRDEIERCRSRGNWLDAVLVRDLVRLPAG